MPDPIQPGGEPFDPNLSAVDWLVQQRQRAGLTAVQGLDGSPDDATRAIELGDATGADPGVVYNNLDDFEQQHKAALTNELVSSNSFLRGIAQSHPLAPVLAQDDWGQLSKVQEAADQLKGKPQMDYVRGRLGPIIANLDPGQQVDVAFPTVEQTRAKWVDQMPPGLAELGRNISQYGIMGGVGMDMVQQVKEGLGVSWGALRAVGTLASRGDVLSATLGLGQVVGGVGQAAGGAIGFNTALKFIGDEYELATGGIVPSEVTQNQLNAVAMVMGMPEEGLIEVGAARRLMDNAHQVGQVAKPFIDAGITPPLGIHPMIDQMWMKQAEADLKNLAALQTEAGKSALRERAPDIFESAIDRELNQHIGVKAEAVRKLYGDKPIQAGDGLLGDAGNVAEQMILAEAHGGDVQIPMGKWLAKVEPEVQKALQDDVRIRTGGVTANEAKEIQDRIAQTPQPTQQPTFAEWLKDNGYTENDPDIDLRQEEYQQFLKEGVPEPTMERLGFKSAGQMRGQKPVRSPTPEGPEWFSLSPEERDARLRKVDEETKGQFRQVPFGVDENWVRGLTYDQYQDMLEGKSQLKPVRSPIIDETSRTIGNALDLARSTMGTELSAGIVRGEGRPGLEGPEGVIPSTAQPTTFKTVAFGGQFQEHASSGSFLVKDGLALIRPEKFQTELLQEVARFFMDPIHRLAGDVMVHVVPDSIMYQIDRRAAAYYEPSRHQIVARESALNGTYYGHQIAAATLLEEAAHAATVREMRSDKQIMQRLDLLRQMTIDHLEQNSPGMLAYHHYSLSNNEEFLAWAWKGADLANTLSKIPLRPGLRHLFRAENLVTAWDTFRWIIKGILTRLAGKAPSESVMDALLRMGPEFERANARMRMNRGEGPQLRGPVGTPTIPDPILDRIKAYGMNAKRAENYRKLVEKAQAEDAAWQLEQGQKAERRRQTAEWQANARQMRTDVEADLKQRPDYLADHYLRTGTFQGKRGARPALDKAGLTPEQIASLPEEYFKGKNKIAPDELAHATGHATGDRLIESLGQLKATQDAAGMTREQHFKSLVDAETARQMELVHGNLEQNIMADAQEHVLGASSLDVTHEELIALAERAGVAAMDKAGIKAAVGTEFNKQTVETISREKYQAAAQRHGQAVEDELAKGESGDARKALQLKSQQVIALETARLAKKFEKEVSADSRLRARLAKTEPTGIDPEYAIWAQDILTRTGTFVRRTVQGMERQKDLVSDSKSLRDFVDAVNAASNIWDTSVDGVSGYNLPMPDFLMDPAYRKDTAKMTVEEFRSVALGLKAINGIGRDIRSFTVKGQRAATEDVMGGLIERMKAFYLNRKLNPEAWHPAQTMGMYLINPERWFNKLDLFNSNGPFNQLLIRPVLEGSYEALAHVKQMAKEWKELATFTDTNKTVPNPLFKDSDGDPIPFTKEKAYAVLANMGNELQRKKLAGGYGIKNVQDIWNWLGTVLTKEDMERQQKMGQFWERWFQKSEEMYAQLRGWIPDRIELEAVQTPWGVYPEWYHPLIRDPLRHPGDLKVGDILDESGYFRPSPPSGYTKQRTGAIYPLDLSFRGMQSRATAMAYDIAMRPPITEVSKIFLNGKFRDAMTKYMGPEYAKAIVPWLKDSAGMRQPGMDGGVERMLGEFRRNLTTLLIGANLGTVFKHGPTALAFSMKEVGARAFLDSFLHMAYETATGNARWRFAFENSQEIPNRMRFMRENISAANEDIFRRYDWNHQRVKFRNLIETVGTAPVAVSDLLSAVPMWDAKYRQLREEGMTHGDAVYAADRAVRNTHGSTIVANRPALMRKGGVWPFLMPFYNFFNNGFQRLYEAGWQAKLAIKGRTLPEMTGFEEEEYKRGLQGVGLALGGFLTYGIIPSLIEQMVDPLPSDQWEDTTKMGAAWHYAKVLARAPISMVPGVRDLVNSVWEGHDVSAGLLGGGFNDIAKPFTINYHKNPDKFLRSVLDMFGAALGITYHSADNLAMYMYNRHYNREKAAAGVPDVVSILRHGTLKEQRPR